MPRDRLLIYAAGFLRALGVGLVGVLFALYLAAKGFHTGQIGLLVAAGIAGNALATFGVSFFADRLGRRKTLLLLSALIVVGGAGLVLLPRFLPLAFVSFLGMVNAMGRERGALFTLEQAIIPATTDDRHRTQALAWYNVVLDAGQALGSLLAGVPFLLRRSFGWEELASYQAAFAGYACLGLAGFFLYMGLSRRVEASGPNALPAGLKAWRGISGPSRRIITRLALLFGMDSIGGGFLPSSLIAFWFFKRFGIGEEWLAPLFFTAHVANAFSYLVAAWISRRIGLVRTMVFTHLPSNLCLLASPFAPSLPVAAAVYLLRESLVEMDVPTRQSYVMAVVAPGERTVAAGITNLTRLVAWTIAPGIAGYAMKGLAMSFPLLAGGGIKIVYDLALYRAFRHVRPPEEQPPTHAA
jgi:MFS family permease